MVSHLCSSERIFRHLMDQLNMSLLAYEMGKVGNGYCSSFAARGLFLLTHFSICLDMLLRMGMYAC
jgi:hypothetical protein